MLYFILRTFTISFHFLNRQPKRRVDKEKTMRTCIILIALASLSGCASLELQRKVYDDRGRELANVSVRHPLATSEGAARLLESARRLEATKQDGDAERRTSYIASKSVDKGQPTSVATKGGQVQSGYVGYGYGGYGSWYDPYGYGYGFYPGADPNMVRVEAMGRGGMSGMPYMLPPLSETVVPPFATPQTGSGMIDPTKGGIREDLDGVRKDLDEVLRVHRQPKKR